MRPHEPAAETGGRQGSRPSELELRTEVDRLRLENQKLVATLEHVSSPLRWARGYAVNAWRSAWQRYYVARWHLLHVRDPRRGLKLRDHHEPYRVRALQAPAADRRRVLHVIGNFHTGGSAQLIVDLVEHLGHRFEQHILVRSLPPRPAYTGIDLIHREKLSEDDVAALLRSIRPDLVHVHMLGHQHDEYGKRDWSWYHKVFRAVERHGCPIVENLNIPVEPYVSDAVRCYVHVSDHVQERFGRLDAWNTTIHPGSDFDVFSRRLDQPVADDCVGMVYRLQPDKLNEHSIEPFIRAVRMRPATKVHIVGGGQFLELYKQRVADAGMSSAFTFPGYVAYADLPDHLARMSVFVAPVHTESFGQVSPFAMGMGLPVVGYDVGALEEITGDPSLLAPAGDADRLAAIMVALLDDRARRLHVGERNRRRAVELFSTRAMVAGYASVYTDVLQGRHAAHARGLASARAIGALQPQPVAPAVTVLMAVFNGERHLKEAVASILNQTFGDFELLIVDDGSTDGSRSIIDAFDDARIRVIENEKNMGLSRSLNRGIALARGRYLARMDADDVSEPNRLARQVEFMDRNLDVAVVGSWYTIVDQDSREIGRRWPPWDDVAIRWMLQFCSPFAHGAAMIRKAVLKDGDPVYDESFAYAMDYDLWIRLADRGRLANLNAFLFRWRISPESMTTRLGDKTERLDRVAASLAGRLGWPAEDVPENERKADLLCSIISGATPDATIEDAEWAIRTLFELHEDFCRRRSLDAAAARALRADLKRQTARMLHWMGHRYPDRQDHRYARTALAAAFRLHPSSLLTGEGLSLVLKVLGGRLTTAAVRRYNRREST